MLLYITLKELVDSIILGIVQGISEWLPISSKTQILITAMLLLKFGYQQAYTFGLFMEIGTILAAVIYFRKELKRLILALVGHGEPLDKKLLVYVVISTVVTGFIGAALYLYADSLSAYNIGIPMIILGIVLILDGVLIHLSRSKAKHLIDLKDMNNKQFALIGFLQGIAALPGVSRSGITTSGLLLMNVKADEAFRLSFLDMIFATSGAVVLTVLAKKSYVIQSISAISPIGLLISILVATVISLLLIDSLIKFAKKKSIIYVVVILGLIAIVFGLIVGVFSQSLNGIATSGLS
ncbi:MAG: undecaprenyl-diphosphatase [Candidatus Micrarchaeota archaeon]|nr:MAG: undecaprenyl-diphosphatase [Candidatus Micrarchaeota archaeon]